MSLPFRWATPGKKNTDGSFAGFMQLNPFHPTPSAAIFLYRAGATNKWDSFLEIPFLRVCVCVCRFPLCCAVPLLYFYLFCTLNPCAKGNIFPQSTLSELQQDENKLLSVKFITHSRAFVAAMYGVAGWGLRYRVTRGERAKRIFGKRERAIDREGDRERKAQRKKKVKCFSTYGFAKPNPSCRRSVVINN